jgi:hypothetical protein
MVPTSFPLKTQDLAPKRLAGKEVDISALPERRIISKYELFHASRPMFDVNLSTILLGLVSLSWNDAQGDKIT